VVQVARVRGLRHITLVQTETEIETGTERERERERAAKSSQVLKANTFATHFIKIVRPSHIAIPLPLFHSLSLSLSLPVEWGSSLSKRCCVGFGFVGLPF